MKSWARCAALAGIGGESVVRRVVLIITVFALFGSVRECFLEPAYAQWWNPFVPSDYEDCAERAARDAKSKEALYPAPKL
jgi:hypothetical protein